MSLSDQDIQSIRDRAADFPARMMSGDFEGISHHYEEDAVLMPTGEGSITGRSQIQEWMKAFPPLDFFQFEIDDIDGDGDMAYVRGRYHMVFAGDEPVDQRGKYLEVRKKQADGSWLMRVDIFNPDA
jgi:ketosteroid isomerase-like protein